jgi:toxin-antitoxin system PIN domain toxin
MTAYLLDVNVLVALFDPQHAHHAAAHRFLEELAARARPALWATCPVTVNGYLRILSHPRYPHGNHDLGDLARRLRSACRSPQHEFWTHAVNASEEGRFDFRQIAGPAQITDAYLLALAVERQGQLVTFDRTIPWRAVRGAKAQDVHLLVS